MIKSEEERKKARESIRDQILTSKEVLDILGFSRVRLSQVVKDGRIEPICDGIYLKDDIAAFQKGEAKITNRPKLKKRDWLIRIRKEKGLRQADVAKHANIAGSYYSSIERGERTPADDTAELIANYLGFDKKKFDEE